MVPELRLPAAPGGLAASVGPDAIVVTWTNPTSRVDRTPLRDLTLVRLYRVADEGDGEAKPAIRTGDAVVGYTVLGTIDLKNPQSRPPVAAVQGNTVRWTDRVGLAVGQRYTYVVTATDSTGRTSLPSTRLSVAYITGPAAPRDLVGQAGEAQARLRWVPPAALRDGAALSGAVTYEVLRSAGPGTASELVTSAPITATEYVDANLENDQTYSYTVRALRAERGTLVRGDLSPPITVTPRDMTPPAPPIGVQAIPSPGTVRLSWTPNAESDLGAYIIYRREATGGPIRVGRVTAPTTVFVDRDLPSGRYAYHVSAADSGSQPNESGPSDAVIVDVP